MAATALSWIIQVFKNRWSYMRSLVLYLTSTTMFELYDLTQCFVFVKIFIDLTVDEWNDWNITFCQYRHLARQGKTIQNVYKQVENSSAFSKYYRGGFDAKMSKREACLILGVSPSASQNKVKEAHKRIMLLNHPDRGGSPYLATKINEAKDYLESKKG